MPEKDNPHKGHRQRMLKKYTEHGIDCFEEHEILEILLFSSYTRRNTNDIAHELIKRFGSLDGVLSAGYDALCEVDNVGHNAAVMLGFYRDLFARQTALGRRGVVLDNSVELRNFCHNMLKERSVEVAYALFLDSGFTLMGEAQVARGVTNRVEFDLKQIVGMAMKNKCDNVVMVHNHPGGVLAASTADVAATRRVANALKELSIQLIDHIIVNEEGAFSMRGARLLPDIWT